MEKTYCRKKAGKSRRHWLAVNTAPNLRPLFTASGASGASLSSPCLPIRTAAASHATNFQSLLAMPDDKDQQFDNLFDSVKPSSIRMTKKADCSTDSDRSEQNHSSEGLLFKSFSDDSFNATKPTLKKKRAISKKHQIGRGVKSGGNMAKSGNIPLSDICDGLGRLNVGLTAPNISQSTGHFRPQLLSNSINVSAQAFKTAVTSTPSVSKPEKKACSPDMFDHSDLDPPSHPAEFKPKESRADEVESSDYCLQLPVPIPRREPARESKVGPRLSIMEDQYSYLYRRESKRSLSHTVVLINQQPSCDVFAQELHDSFPSLHEESTIECHPGLISLIQDTKRDLIDVVLSYCTSSSVLPLASLYDEQLLLQSRKVGEGTFGEVFLLANEEASVLKIVPVDGDRPLNGQPQTPMCNVLAEIMVCTELSNLADRLMCNFVQVRSCFLTQGPYPSSLLRLWDDFDTRVGSENERPDPELFGQGQQFVVLEFSNGGTDLEHTELQNAAQGLSLFRQVVFSLAMAEQTHQFEHRDLHWGNVLVRACTEDVLSYAVNGSVYNVETHHVQATIIDFSLSRLKSSKDHCLVYNNLSDDPDLFVAEGDYQFDIYRLMQQHTGNEWKYFYPKTNVMWLHYLLDKLTTHVSYKNKKSKTHRQKIAKLRILKSRVLDFSNALDFSMSQAFLEA